MVNAERYFAGIVFSISCITFPWEVPERTVIVERDGDRWRVVARGHPITIFRSRFDAVAHAQQIAAKFWPPWTVTEREDTSRDAVAC